MAGSKSQIWPSYLSDKSLRATSSRETARSLRQIHRGAQMSNRVLSTKPCQYLWCTTSGQTRAIFQTSSTFCISSWIKTLSSSVVLAILATSQRHVGRLTESDEFLEWPSVLVLNCSFLLFELRYDHQSVFSPEVWLSVLMLNCSCSCSNSEYDRRRGFSPEVWLSWGSFR